LFASYQQFGTTDLSIIPDKLKDRRAHWIVPGLADANPALDLWMLNEGFIYHETHPKMQLREKNPKLDFICYTVINMVFIEPL
jgi:hypothetical protein